MSTSIKNKIYLYLLSLGEPICLLVHKNTESILDIGCGQGYPMKLLKLWKRPKLIVGVDLFEPYIKEARKAKIHDKYVLTDIRKKLPFKEKSFDTVVSLQVLEHLTKKDAMHLLSQMERIAKKQVIVATPIGHMHHPEVDNNPHQAHKSAFYPKDFEKKGYKVLKFGRKSILGEHGVVHKTPTPIRQTAFLLNFILTPLFYMVQPLSDYHVYAYKDLSK